MQSPARAHAGTTVSVTPLSESLGARIDGMNLATPLSADALSRLYQTYLDRHVVALPGQQLTVERLLDFSRHFGPLESHIMSRFHHPDTPLILLLSNEQERGKPKGLADAGTYWHSDVSYKARPSRATVLFALEVPDEGGDTLFTNMMAAYEDLPDATRRRIEGLRAVHDYAYRSDRLADEVGVRPKLTEEQRRTTRSMHPVVRTHPETGRKALYVNPGFTTGIEGMGKAESKALLEELFEHSTQEKYRLRYKWQAGDVVLWDNAAVMHAATTRDLPAHKRRVIWRTIVSGDEPY